MVTASATAGASVADSIGASGLIAETTQRGLNARHAYPLIGALALVTFGVALLGTPAAG